MRLEHTILDWYHFSSWLFKAESNAVRYFLSSSMPPSNRILLAKNEEKAKVVSE
jgi:hypothetical protein